MNYEELKELISYCESKNLLHFEFVYNDIKIAFSKCENIPGIQSIAESDQFQRPLITKAINMENKVIKEKKEMTPNLETLDEKLNDKNNHNAKIIQIKSPYVGIITISEKILNGEVRVCEKTDICTIEAMKIYNSIISPVNGTVKDIFVEDGSLVEYDQLIMNIEADEI